MGTETSEKGKSTLPALNIFTGEIIAARTKNGEKGFPLFDLFACFPVGLLERIP